MDAVPRSRKKASPNHIAAIDAINTYPIATILPPPETITYDLLFSSLYFFFPLKSTQNKKASLVRFSSSSAKLHS